MTVAHMQLVQPRVSGLGRMVPIEPCATNNPGTYLIDSRASVAL